MRVINAHVTWLAFVALLPFGVSQPDADAFAYPGRIAQYASELAVVAPPSGGGIGFSVTLDAAGKVAPEAKFALSKPSWKGEGSLSLTGMAYSGGSLTGSFQVANTTPTVLEGIRVDWVDLVERYKGKDAEGKEVILSRSKALTSDGPWMTADLQPKQSSQVQAFKTSGIVLAPETVDVTLRGTVSGMALVGHLNISGSEDLFALDFDGRGRLYVTSNVNGAIYRMNPDGSGISTFATLPGGSISISVNRISGEVIAQSWNADRLFRFSATGQDAEGLMQDDDVPGLGGWASSARYARDGSLFCVFGGTFSKMAGKKPAFVLEGVGAFKFEDALHYDFGPDGTIWIGTASTVFRVPADGKGGTRPIIGPSLKLGNVAGITALRCDAAGNVYVAERRDAEHYARISVFDSQGRFIRVFGRGDSKPPGEDEEIRTGQIHTQVRSMAFGPDGRLYFSHGHLDQPIVVFEPF
jgi:hypothetical protein